MPIIRLNDVDNLFFNGSDFFRHLVEFDLTDPLVVFYEKHKIGVTLRLAKNPRP